MSQENDAKISNQKVKNLGFDSEILSGEKKGIIIQDKNATEEFRGETLILEEKFEILKKQFDHTYQQWLRSKEEQANYILQNNESDSNIELITNKLNNLFQSKYTTLHHHLNTLQQAFQSKLNEQFVNEDLQQNKIKSFNIHLQIIALLKEKILQLKSQLDNPVESLLPGVNEEASEIEENVSVNFIEKSEPILPDQELMPDENKLNIQPTESQDIFPSKVIDTLESQDSKVPEEKIVNDKEENKVSSIQVMYQDQFKSFDTNESELQPDNSSKKPKDNINNWLMSIMWLCVAAVIFFSIYKLIQIKGAKSNIEQYKDEVNKESIINKSADTLPYLKNQDSTYTLFDDSIKIENSTPNSTKNYSDNILKNEIRVDSSKLNTDNISSSQNVKKENLPGATNEKMIESKTETVTFGED